ncbi:MAG: sel1 repeat family protein [Bacteroidales bacterium]|nr:sel1 repeat family protein [Bacteroidales bacterium]
MKRKLKLLVTLVLGITLMVGFNSCGKESSGGIEPTPVNPTPNNGGGGNDKPTPEPDNKPTPENPDVQQLYEDAFKIISESHDYKKAVENLTQAAEANVDSANLTLAYMYEYGIGVNQDIEKAKDLYAREASAHNNEFAADKLASLSSTHNNCVVQLPEGCNIRTNEVLIDCGDTITVANGDGSFNTSARLVRVFDFDGNYINICYRHPDYKGKTELNSLETAVTMMLCHVPYAFKLTESAYKKVREQLLQLDETKQLAEEIDRQVKANGHFDMASLAPMVVQGRKAIVATYGGGSPQSKTKQIFAGTVERDGFILRDDYDNYCSVGEGSVKNDITTTFKSGYYDTEKKEWNTVVNIHNLSQVCVMAVPGMIDPETHEYVTEYDDWYDRLLHGTFVTASSFFDFGGGSFSGFVESNMNFFYMLWECTYNDNYPSSIDHISLVDDMKTSYNLWIDAQRAYREKYNAVDEELELPISTNRTALKYYYPYNAGELFVFYLAYYCVVPIIEFSATLPGKESNAADAKTKKKTAIIYVLKRLAELLKDKEVLSAAQQLLSTHKWRDESAIKLYNKIILAMTQGVNDKLAEEGYMDKNFTKVVSTQFEVGQKIEEGKYDKAFFKEAKIAEKIVLNGNKEAEKFTKLLSTSEDLITFFDGAIGMLIGDYRSYLVRFGMSNEDWHLIYSPIENITDGVSTIFVAKPNSGEPTNLYIYANDRLLVKEEEAIAISYDLSKLSIGTYDIKVVGDFIIDDGAACNFVRRSDVFKCHVNPPFNGGISITPVHGESLNDAMGKGFIPDAKGHELESSYNSGASLSGVKGHEL